MQTVAPRCRRKRDVGREGCYVTPSLAALSLCSASQSRNRGSNRLIGKGGRCFMHSAVTLGELSICPLIFACSETSVRSSKILGGFPYCKIMWIRLVWYRGMNVLEKAPTSGCTVEDFIRAGMNCVEKVVTQWERADCMREKCGLKGMM